MVKEEALDEDLVQGSSDQLPGLEEGMTDDEDYDMSMAKEDAPSDFLEGHSFSPEGELSTRDPLNCHTENTEDTEDTVK